MSDNDTIRASDCECVIEGCESQAVAFWPVIDPDIPKRPYCRPCLDDRKHRVMKALLEDSP